MRGNIDVGRTSYQRKEPEHEQAYGGEVSRRSKAQPEEAPGEVTSTEYVLVRTYSAGVHYGILNHTCDTKVRLVNARRIARWRGAMSCTEIALDGIEDSKEGWSRVSKRIGWIDLLEAIEILPITSVALAKLDACGWAK